LWYGKLLKIINRTVHLILLVSAFFLFDPCKIRAEFIYIGNFEDGKLGDWEPYTDDDNPESGWMVKGGKIVQTVINGDKVKGGVRLLLKDNLLDLMDTNHPTTATLILDICPLDYKEESGDVWFGLGFLVDSANPISNSVIIALRKNEEEKKSGLHIYSGPNGWVSGKNNFEIPLFKWCRIKVFIENQISKRSFQINAKAWFTSNPEPDNWLASAKIPYNKINVSVKGVFMGAYATLGNKGPRGYKKRGNPRVAFDNFIIYKGDVSRIPYNFYSSSEDEIEPMMTLSEEQNAMELYEFAHKIGPPYPDYGGFDRLMFLEMLFYREISRWDEAALNANSFIDLFPKSPYTARMGGKDGRTEDEAAIEYANATTPFQANDYKQSYNLFQQFLVNYPNNWRHDIAQYRMIFSIYYMALSENKLNYDLIDKIDAAINENPESIYIDDMMPLIIGAHIRLGNKKEARKLLDDVNKTFSYSSQKEEFEHLWMDSYLYPSVVDKEELKNNPELINLCTDRAFKYYEEGNNKRSAKYISYLIKYYELVDGEDKVEENLRDLKDKAMQKSKQMHDFIEFTQASIYWYSNKEKGIQGYQSLLDANPEPEIRKECVQKILEFMASKGTSFAELKAFKEKYEKEVQK